MNFLVASLVLASVFITDPDTGQIVEVQSEIENPSDDLFQTETGETEEAEEEIGEEEVKNEPIGEDNDLSINAGNEISDEEENSEGLEEIPEATPSDAVDSTPSELELQVVELLEEQVELLSQSSLASSGNMNSQVLELMDRIINGLPPDYKYAGFRVSNTDAYRCTLYIGTKADVSGSWINFGKDCVAVDFYRYTSNNTSYLYYTTSSTPDASVYAGGNTIVYTNAIEYRPSLGESPDRSVTLGQTLVVAFFAVVLNYILQRRTSS